MNWISVNERLPEPIVNKRGELDAQEVLVYAPDYPEQHLGRYLPRLCEFRFAGSNSDFTEDITHWMPLPDPPRVSK